MEFSDELLDAYQSIQEDYDILADKYVTLQKEHLELLRKYINLLKSTIPQDVVAKKEKELFI